MTGPRLCSTLAISLLLAACSSPETGSSANDTREEFNDSEPWAPDGLPPQPAVANAWAPRPEDALPRVRGLMRETIAAEERCRHGTAKLDGSRPDCDAYLALRARLKEKGWCWDEGPPRAEQGWVRCIDDPDDPESRHSAYRQSLEAQNVTR